MASSAKKDQKTGKWSVQYRYTDWTGTVKKSTKRGFNTKREAEEWLREFISVKQGKLDMSFSSFVQLYFEDMEKRLRQYTVLNKHYIIDLKILPYFGDVSVNKIKSVDLCQ